MIVSQRSVAVVTLATFVVGIGLTMAFNLWNTSPPRGRTLANPAEIRGSTTLVDVATLGGPDLATLARAFRWPEDQAATAQPKDLEAQWGDLGVGTDSVRLFVALWTGRPFVPEAATRLFPEALDALKTKLSPADWDRAAVWVVGGPGPGEANPAPESSAPAAGERTIKGSTTFGELLTWGMSEAELRRVLGGLGAGHESVRTWAQAQGLEFSTVKAQLQALVTP